MLTKTSRAHPGFFIGGGSRPKAEDREWGGVIYQLRGLGERCKLPHRGSGWSPNRPKVTTTFSTHDGLSRHYC